jgi:type II secretory pathway component PulJ
MGFNTLLDILGAMFIGGILMLSLFQVNTSVIINNGYYTTDTALQEGMLNLVQLIQRDLRRMGYSQTPGFFTDAKSAITQADTSTFTMIGDVDNNGTIDTVTYSVGATNQMTSGSNPNDRFLYRKVNSGTPNVVFLGVTVFNFVYYDLNGAKLATPIPASETGGIKSIQVSIQAQSSTSYRDAYSKDSSYANVYWRQLRLSSKNLNNR